MLLYIHYYFINFVEGLIPCVSEAHCGYTSLQEYVITICYTMYFLQFGALIRHTISAGYKSYLRFESFERLKIGC